MAYGTNKHSLDAYKQRFCASWFYASLASTDDEESGIDDPSVLSGDEDDLSAALLSRSSSDDRQRRNKQLTFPLLYDVDSTRSAR